MRSAFVLALFLRHFVVPESSVTAPVSPERTVPSAVTVSVEEIVSPTRQSVAPGSQRVPMLNVSFTAACDGDVTVESIALQRRGLGSNDDIAAVYAMEGTKRVSQSRQITDRQGNVSLRLEKFVIDACASKKISVLVDFTATAAVSGEHRFILDERSDIDAGNAAVTLKKSTVTQTRRTVGRTQGAINIEYVSLTERVRYGERQEVQRIRMEATGEDALLTAVTFTNRGSARDLDLRNFYLQGGNRRLTPVASSLEGDRIRLVFDPPLLLQKNEIRLFILRADVRASRSRTIDLIIEEPSDLENSSVRGRNRGL
jgi:hypothetical protein